MKRYVIKVANNIKFLWKEKGYTQDEMAKLIGVSQAAIGNWETGTREPNLQMITKIARFFSVSLDDLLLKDLSKEV